MISLIVTPSMAQLADKMKRHAETGLFRGFTKEVDGIYFRKAKQLHEKTGTQLIFTRDTGHHSGGWFKNPDYERCYHLSVSFLRHDRETEWGLLAWDVAEFNPQLAKLWCHIFFGSDVRYIWDESNRTHHHEISANDIEIHHYRVFCDPKWKPIIPRGEVYTRDFIEKGWQSWSDQHADN